jgi:hypothetical protein
VSDVICQRCGAGYDPRYDCDRCVGVFGVAIREVLPITEMLGQIRAPRLTLDIIADAARLTVDRAMIERANPFAAENVPPPESDGRQ